MSSTGILGLLFVLDRQAVTIFVAGQRLEEIDRPQIALAQDGERLGVLDVLQVDAVNTVAERLDRIDRVDLRAEEVAGVDAAADLGMVVLDRLG